MKFAAIMLVAAGLAVAGSASAAASSAIKSDVDYLKASRCKGLAQGLGGIDTAALDAALKSERFSRADAIVDRAAEEMARAKRQAANANLKDQLSAEVAGACMAYLSPSKDMASR
ncbi:hypothetical protein [Phenylobacterium soli]|uniref:Uncharacterized protein n=1 Tax=Phenylobacterium soli TaxID=2170551 RepID=A0A328AP27_9CAUL|nr:hypothetical protein [Phenylobacterium soli]RAK56071.1 hypothetical protein DJ017_16915 [Phenylobacterium soli]